MIDEKVLVSEMQALIRLGPYDGYAAERIMQCMTKAVELILTYEAAKPKEAEATCARDAQVQPTVPGMPDEEEIARVIREAGIDEYKAAQRILSLIRPAFEAKTQECQAICDSYAAENQQLHDRALSAEAKLAQAVEALTAVQPYLGAIVCYASTINEHDGNRVAKLVAEFLALAEGKEG